VTITTAPPVAPPRTPWHLEATVRGAAAVGVLPGTSAGVRLSLGVEPPRWWPFAIAVGWWDRAETDAGAAGRRVSLARAEVSALLSTPIARLGRVGLSLRGGATVAWIEGHGVGFELDRATTSATGAATLAGRATFDLRRALFVAAEVVGEVPIVRPVFVDGQGMQVYRVSPAALFAGLGVGVRI
jgi:hypothetical protein